VPIPASARDAVADIAARVQAAVDGEGAHIRWVRMEGLHLTLRFLGPTPEARLPELTALADEAAAEVLPFAVRISGAGAFPTTGHPRTLWLGLSQGVAQLASLAGAIEAGVVRHGDALDTRPFAPHLTIARTDGVRAAPHAARILEELAGALDIAFVADRLVVYRSHLGRGRATYEALHEARFGS
jgi:2'-5' RNA ligase